MRDGWLSWPWWLTDSGQLNHTVVTHPDSSLAQDRESSPGETSVLTTMLMLRRQLPNDDGNWQEWWQNNNNNNNDNVQCGTMTAVWNFYEVDVHLSDYVEHLDPGVPLHGRRTPWSIPIVIRRRTSWFIACVWMDGAQWDVIGGQSLASQSS